MVATVTSARTASSDSMSIPPYPTSLASVSRLICLEVVPEPTSEWNPEMAPQATVTNSAGNRYPSLGSWKPVVAAYSIFGL